MNIPDPNADRARRFADEFNAAAEHDWAREWRKKLFPGLTEAQLDALAALDARLGRCRPANGDAIGFFNR